MGAGAVLEGVLLETDAVETDPGEGGGVGATGGRGGSELGSRDGDNVLVFNGFDPGFEDGAGCWAASGGDTAEAAGAAVVVEVDVELVVLRGLLHGVAWGEVLLDVGGGTIDSFLFAAPEGDADGAGHGLVEGGEDAYGFHGD